MEVTINYNGQALTVEVTVEVYEYLDRADHKEENLSHEKRRHWDGREFDEYIAFTEGGAYSETPEEYLCRKEALDELLSVLASYTDTQQRRFLLYALDGLSYAEIAARCGCSKYAVRDSIMAVRKVFKTFLKTAPTIDPLSGYPVRRTFFLYHQRGQAVFALPVLSPFQEVANANYQSTIILLPTLPQGHLC